MHLRSLVMLPGMLLAAACWRSPAPPSAAFEVERVSPPLAGEGAVPLLLNDSITVYFSHPLQSLSVTPDSVTVVDHNGNPVPGGLLAGTNWVTFTPEAPLAPDLLDGTFRPGEDYKLVVAGYPRPDAVRASDGRRLAGCRMFPIHMAESAADHGYPAPLRPPLGEPPFALNAYDTPQPLPVDGPRLQLHFTVPVLPSSVRPQAFRIQLMRPRRLLLDVAAHSARVVESRLDRLRGSTIEIDLGPEARTVDGEPVALKDGDVLSVAIVEGQNGLRDLAGAPVLPSVPQPWIVVPGATLKLLALPAGDGGIVGDDETAPGFESVAGTVRPRVRVEAGDGSLGVFRPLRDTVLRPGEPFDRGDGKEVRSRGGAFPFTAIDVPAGVRVVLDASREHVQLQASGGIRLRGTLEVQGQPTPLPSLQHGVAVRELLEQAGVALVAAGDIRLDGDVVVAGTPSAGLSQLMIACAGRIQAAATLPVNTVLAIESQGLRGEAPIPGARGQTVVLSTAFTYGMAEGARWRAEGTSAWRRVGLDCDGGLLHLSGVDPGMRVLWQQTAADPVDAERPDRRPDRVQRPQWARDGDWLAVEPGSFVRFVIEAELAADRPLPTLREVRLLSR